MNIRLFRKREPKPFLDVKQFEGVLAAQRSMTPKTLAVLQDHGVDVISKLRLEYFFYTNSAEKAQELAASLRAMGYTSDVQPAASKKNQHLINGWTRQIEMTENELVSWTETMCRLGLSYDCEFDGWGTFPDQSEEMFEEGTPTERGD